jgi:hypothetical protein
MFVIQDLLVSPDRKYLAVLSSGEGHPVVEVVDLPRLTATQAYIVVRSIHPYPDSVAPVGWAGGRLILESTTLLDLALQVDRLERDCLHHPWSERQAYALDVGTGGLDPISETARNPVPFLAERLRGDHPRTRLCAARALHATGSPSAVEPLAEALRTEQDVDVRAALEVAIRDIQGESSGQVPRFPIFSKSLG